MLKRSVLWIAGTLLLLSSGAAFGQQGTIVFNNIPDPIPPNVPSYGFECCQLAEIGDLIQLEADTPRFAATAKVLMSSWAKHSEYPDEFTNDGYEHPITLNIYTSTGVEPIQTTTQNFLIPWRPEADPDCGTAWKGADGNCYNGKAFTITFDLKGLNYSLPEQFKYGIAFDTNTEGYNPIGKLGPYNSLNVGTANVKGAPVPPSVGVDVEQDGAFASYNAGPFLPDTGYSLYPIAVQFTTFGFPETISDCKNGAWRNLVRPDFSVFKNQGDCVSYVNTGK
jgi:hypothetical protein